MQAQRHRQRLAALRDIIAEIERKPALAELRAGAALERDGAFPRLPGGLVQEVYTDTVRNGGASLAFALGQARQLLSGRRQAVFYLQLAADGGFFGLPYAPGLVHFGLDPARLLLVRTADMTEFLWAAEEILACRAVAAIIADTGGDTRPLDFTASRRLSLRACASGTSLFLLRYGQAREASAAHLRWHLLPGRSGSRPHDERAPGRPRWRLVLERETSLKRQGEWLLEWRQDGFATLSARSTGPQRDDAGTALPGAVPAALAHRLPQTA
jgi:Uncharacterized conserved protein